MADLDYSKQLEQDADALLFIYHPKPKQRKDESGKPYGEPLPQTSMLLLKKNRDGAKGVVHVDFRREYVKFYEVEDD